MRRLALRTIVGSGRLNSCLSEPCRTLAKQTGLALLTLLLTGSALGCRAIPVHQQRRVARPNMQFSDSPVFAYTAGVLSQIETGAAAAAGAQAAGCTSCR